MDALEVAVLVDLLIRGQEPWTSPKRWAPGYASQGKSWYVILPLWIPTAALGFVGAQVWRRPVRRLWRLRRGCCPACGYDLRASRERCPECGLGMLETALRLR
jgi:hypothetical protein